MAITQPISDSPKRLAILKANGHTSARTNSLPDAAAQQMHDALSQTPRRKIYAVGVFSQKPWRSNCSIASR